MNKIPKIHDEGLAKRANSLLRNGNMEEGIAIMYEMLTDDIEATCADDDTSVSKKLFVVDTVMKYYSAPAVEDYEKCIVLRGIKERLEALIK